MTGFRAYRIGLGLVLGILTPFLFVGFRRTIIREP